MTPADALLSLSAIETAVYDPPRLLHEFEYVHVYSHHIDRKRECLHCGYVMTYYSDTNKPCPARPAPDPDWQACAIAADICEDMQDMAGAAWWRWLHEERKVPEWNSTNEIWQWWHRAGSDNSNLPAELYIKLSIYRGILPRLHLCDGFYDTRRAAYLDLARSACEQWRQEHETKQLPHEFDAPGLICHHCREIASSNYNAGKSCPARSPQRKEPS